MDETKGDISSYLEVFYGQDRALADRVVRSEPPASIRQSFQQALWQLLEPEFGVSTQTTHTPELGPMGELPPESRRDVARSLIQGRQTDVTSRVSAVEQTHQVPDPSVPELAFHVIGQSGLGKLASADRVEDMLVGLNFLAGALGKESLAKIFPDLLFSGVTGDFTVIKSDLKGAELVPLSGQTPARLCQEYVDVTHGKKETKAVKSVTDIIFGERTKVNLVDVAIPVGLTQKVEQDQQDQPDASHIYILSFNQTIAQIKNVYTDQPEDQGRRDNYGRPIRPGSIRLTYDQLFRGRSLLYSEPDKQFIFIPGDKPEIDRSSQTNPDDSEEEQFYTDE